MEGANDFPKGSDQYLEQPVADVPPHIGPFGMPERPGGRLWRPEGNPARALGPGPIENATTLPSTADELNSAGREA